MDRPRRAITEQRTTGYYVTDDNATLGTYTDEDGHMWFSRPIALEIARQTGGDFFKGVKGSVKTVVTGYEAA
jgi:hypothetical protein